VRQVELLYFDDCPNWREVDDALQRLAGEVGFELTRRLVDTPEQAAGLRFRGSPSILVDGIDPFASGNEPVGLSCRIYQTPAGPAGSPTLDQLRAVLAAQK
jgi:hypothetical protein